MVSRRKILIGGARVGMASAMTPLWSQLTSLCAFAERSSSPYRALILVTLLGGNDGNNMLIPMDSIGYRQYAALRSSIALPQQSILPLATQVSGESFGLHPSLKSIADLYHRRQALFVANVGPMSRPATKEQLLERPSLLPASLMDHMVGVAQWESATTVTSPTSGWGGRMADFLAAQSGLLPPVLDAGPSSIFTVGRSVQGITVQTHSESTTPLPPGINAAILAIANHDVTSPNYLVSETAKLQRMAFNEQDLLLQAEAAKGTLRTVFPDTNLGGALRTIAHIVNGRSVIGATRQIFYCNHRGYDTHHAQLATHAANLADLDSCLGALMCALDEMELSDQVLICTHSDFNRTMQANTSGGTDHGWGNHQIILGGGISGGRIAGTMPHLDLGGSSDLASQGIWIPTTSVTQMAAAIGNWMGLTGKQLATVFPDLANFGNQWVPLL
jgi:uncharacterized protein (DUF1501 family)